VKYLLAHDPVNQPIDYLINSSHVTSNGTYSHYQNKLVLASATCLRALYGFSLLNNYPNGPPSTGRLILLNDHELGR